MDEKTLPLLAPLRRNLRRSARRVFGKHPLAMVPALMLYNLWWAIKLALGRAEMEFQETTRDFTTEAAADYIEGVFNNFKRRAGIQHFSGHAAELGPGGNAGVGLLMRGDGCDTVEMVDRFVIRTDPATQAAVYAELSRRHGLDQFRVGDSWKSHAISGVTWHEGEPAERWAHDRAARPEPSYDFVGSHGVLQSLYDPLTALRDMASCLRPGGHLVHQIDLRDQRFFSQTGNELQWLSVPTRIWPWLTRNAGLPNRVLVHQYRHTLEDLKRSGNIDYLILVTQLIGQGPLAEAAPFESIDKALVERSMVVVEAARSGFAKEFRNIPASDLCVACILITATRK